MATLNSTNGDGIVKLDFRDLNEDIVLISSSIKRRTYEASESCDFVEFIMPNFPCFKHSLIDLIDKLRSWCRSDFETLSNSPLYIKKELSSADYTMNNSFLIEIGDSDIHRTIPDQRKLKLKFDVGYTKFEVSFTIDPTGTDQFVKEFDKIYKNS